VTLVYSSADGVILIGYSWICAPRNIPGKAYSSTEGDNATNLTNELKVLSIAQYFLDTFKKCAVSYGYMSLPGMCLNLTPRFSSAQSRLCKTSAQM
jgi:hypothetical protein